MKKIIYIMFFCLSLFAYADITEIKIFDDEYKDIIDYEQDVSGTNKQNLNIMDVDQKELILNNQDLENSDAKINGKKYKLYKEKIVIEQTNDIKLKEEISQGIQNNNLQFILIGIGVGIGALILVNSF